MRVKLITNLIIDGQVINKGTILEVDHIIGPQMEEIRETVREIIKSVPIKEIITEEKPVEISKPPVKYVVKKAKIIKKGGKKNGNSRKN